MSAARCSLSGRRIGARRASSRVCIRSTRHVSDDQHSRRWPQTAAAVCILVKCAVARKHRRWRCSFSRKRAAARRQLVIVAVVVVDDRRVDRFKWKRRNSQNDDHKRRRQRKIVKTIEAHRKSVKSATLVQQKMNKRKVAILGTCQDHFLDCPVFEEYCRKVSFFFVMKSYCSRTCGHCR